jgi:hypothetical protein
MKKHEIALAQAHATLFDLPNRPVPDGDLRRHNLMVPARKAAWVVGCKEISIGNY